MTYVPRLIDIESSRLVFSDGSCEAIPADLYVVSPPNVLIRCPKGGDEYTLLYLKLGTPKALVLAAMRSNFGRTV